MKNIFFIIGSAILVFFTISGCVLHPEIKVEDEIRDGQRKGDLLVRKLEDYKNDQQIYPKSLADLAPQYISEIPKTLTGRDFIFIQNDKDIYYLSFPVTSGENVGSGIVCTYIKRLDGWDCSQSFE